MPSSTSSFKTYELTRIIPKHHWLLLAALTTILTVILTVGWETYVRSIGYAPSLNDTEDLWSSRRAIVDEEPGRTVLIGSSRMLFDFDMDIFEKEFSRRPLQLATVGTNPGPYLEDLANHSEYSGTVIVGVVPGLFFAPGGPPMKSPLNHLKHFRDWSPTQKFGHYVSRIIEKRFSFLNDSDLTLNQLLLDLKIPNREKVKTKPELPPHFHDIDAERQGAMTEFSANNSALQKRIQQIWIPLFTPPPPPKGKTAEEAKADFGKAVEMILDKTKTHVEQIRKKGGKVIFLRLPSTGQLREMENKFTPREHFWDRIIKTTGAPGIHFEDYKELNGFDCPEWSHLNRADAIEFTKRLMPILAEHL
ncbi:MAG: hypothetical protein HOK41_11255 [Nitrospina sp.]|jgi:hypothetical protein|nr:hypothetical protein [Nitrospina sp.]